MKKNLNPSQQDLNPSSEKMKNNTKNSNSRKKDLNPLLENGYCSRLGICIWIPHTRDSNLSRTELSKVAWDPNPRALDSNPQSYKCIKCKSKGLVSLDLRNSSLSQRLIYSPTTINDSECINTTRNSEEEHGSHLKDKNWLKHTHTHTHTLLDTLELNSLPFEWIFVVS